MAKTRLELLMRSPDFVNAQDHEGIAWKVVMKDGKGGFRAEYIYKADYRHPEIRDPRIGALKPDEFTDDGLPYAYIVDIDGTVALIKDRSPYATERCMTDEVNRPVAEILKSAKSTLIYLTGRPEKYREVTKKWLKENGLWFDTTKLLMRADDDKTPDNEMKKKLFMDNVYGQYNVELVLEDRDRNVRMYRDELRLPVLQPWYGNF